MVKIFFVTTSLFMTLVVVEDVGTDVDVAVDEDVVVVAVKVKKWQFICNQ